MINAIRRAALTVLGGGLYSTGSVGRKARRAVFEQVEPRLLLTVLDGTEVDGLPSSMVVPLYTFIGDHSSSNSEKWSMKVGDKWHSAPDYGVVQRDQRGFKRGEAYAIELRHDGSNRAAGPDYDYRAWVDKYANPAWTSGATTISGTDYFAVDTNSPALMQKRWFGEDQNNAAGKTATLVIPGIDLDVDTANDDGFGTVYDNAAEDRDEELTTKGKYVVANTGDLDSDGVIDNADFNGIAGASFVPMLLRLPASMQLAGAALADVKFTFDYSMAELVANASGVLRIWTVDSSSARGEWEFLRSGEQVSAADLGMTFGGTKTLYVEAVKGHTSNQTITVATDVAGTAWSGTVSDKVRVTPIGFKIKSVSFDSFTSGQIYPITKDDGSVTYNTLHWLDANLDGDADDSTDHKYPVAYKQQAAMVVSRLFEAVAPANFAISNDLVVRGQGTDGYNFWSQPGAGGNTDSKNLFQWAPNSANVLQTIDTASKAFPSAVDHFDPMTIKWSFSTDAGSNWSSVGDTKNQVYVLLDAPVKTASTLRHTVAHLATKLSKGLSDPASVTAAIWTEFTDRDVRTATTTGAPASKQLTYYANYQNTNLTTLSLLNSGDGQCGAWASLFIDTLRAHGLDDAQYMLLKPNDLNGNGMSNDEGFIVNNWTFAAAGSSPDPLYPFVNFYDPAAGYTGATSYNWWLPDVTDGAGTPGQGNPNPASLFNNHQVVRINGSYYDPSSGVSYASLAALETAAIAGYYRLGGVDTESNIGRDVNGDGDVADTAAFMFFRTNPAANQLTEEVIGY